MGLYSQFQTDKGSEKTGIVVDYHHFRVRLARAGGANKDFLRVLAAKSKPHRRAIQTETIDPDLAQALEREVYAETVILDWETLVDEENMIYERGVEAPDGSLLDVTPENIVKTFENLPDLFQDLKNQANTLALFRKDELEADAKNS